MVNLLSAGGFAGIGAGASKGFLGWFKLGFMGFILTFFLINAILIAYEEKDITPAIKDLGNRLLNPLLNINDESLSLINDINGEIAQLSLFDKIMKYWSILSDIFIIYMGIRIFYIIITFFLGSSVPGFTISLISIAIFLILVIVTLALQDKSLMTPLYAFSNLFKFIIKIIKDFYH